MMRKAALLAVASLLVFPAPALAAEGPSDPEIAHIAYTAGTIDISAAEQALAKSRNEAVRAFAEGMVRDHRAVNEKALALVKKLNVTPADNAVSASLGRDASTTMSRLAKLNGAAFDRAYLENEVAYHKAVNAALGGTLIPSADNGELKALLETGLTLFSEHQAHAEHVAAQLK